MSNGNDGYCFQEMGSADTRERKDGRERMQH